MLVKIKLIELAGKANIVIIVIISTDNFTNVFSLNFIICQG